MFRDFKFFGRRLVGAINAGASSPRMLAEITSALREGVEASRRVEERLSAILDEARLSRLQAAWINLGPDRVLEFQYEDWPIRMHLPEGPTDFIERNILFHRTFYQVDTLATLRGHVKIRGETVIDVGANIGNHAVYFGKVCGAERVIAFEPMTKSYRALTRNLEINGINAEARQVAIGAEDGVGHSIINPTNAGGSGFYVGSGEVSVGRLDALDLPPFAVLKIDVEGMVADVLRGAGESIARYKPEIIVEAFDFQFHEIDALLKAHGYGLVASAHDDHVYKPI